MEFFGKVNVLGAITLFVFSGCALTRTEKTFNEVGCPRDELTLSEIAGNGWIASCRGARFKCVDKGGFATCWKDSSTIQNQNQNAKSNPSTEEKADPQTSAIANPVSPLVIAKKKSTSKSNLELFGSTQLTPSSNTLDSKHVTSTVPENINDFWKSEQCWKELKEVMYARVNQANWQESTQTPIHFVCSGKEFLCMMLRENKTDALTARCKPFDSSKRQNSSGLTEGILNFYNK